MKDKIIDIDLSQNTHYNYKAFLLLFFFRKYNKK